MFYPRICSGVFLSRPNRFIAYIEIDGRTEICHVKNTGRCRELLVPGVEVFVQLAENPLRKTRYDLITVRKGDRLINIDSQAPNRVFSEWLQSDNHIRGLSLIRPECSRGTSRFDFYLEAAEMAQRRIFVETKGVTLEIENVAMFPDAPTERGVKHVEELIRCTQDGYESWIVFIIQMKGIVHFTPNDATHPAFGQALRKAAAQGVRLLALDCQVTPQSIFAADAVPIRL